MRKHTEPVLSVVVVIVSDTTRARYDTAHLEGTLEALSSQTGAPRMEVIVPFVPPLPNVTALKRRFPLVQFVPAAGLTSYTGPTPGREHHDELRARGIALAQGPLIALLEDHGRPTPGWAAAMIAAHEQPYAAAGGAIENGSPRALNEAVCLCDFARYQNPLARGESPHASDANVSYKKSSLDAVRRVWKNSFQETAVNHALVSAGHKLALEPGAVVFQHRLQLNLRSACGERFLWGRSYARSRSALLPPAKRLVYAALTPLLPFVLSARIARGVIAKGRANSRFVKALPLIAVLETAWACGELAGYWNPRSDAPPLAAIRTGQAS